MDEESLAHSKCRCQYHLVFAPKYRRSVIYGKLKKEIGKIFGKLCKYKTWRYCKRKHVRIIYILFA